jgi:hypothetical protein
MAEAVTFTVTHPEAPYVAADPGIGRIAEEVAAQAQAATPVRTGTLAAGWRVAEGDRPAVRLVTNDVLYAKFVEYGTRDMSAEPMIGPVLARFRGGGA